MSFFSPSRSYFPEKFRYAAGLGQAGKYRVNVQIGNNQLHVSLLLPETRTFNYIMDELQPMFTLSDFQRQHTRIFLQTILGETEVLVDARPNYQTERNIDYVAVPAYPAPDSRLQRKSGLLFCLLLFLLVQIMGLAIFVAIEFAVLRPKLVQAARGGNVTQQRPPPQVPVNVPPVPPSTNSRPTPNAGMNAGPISVAGPTVLPAPVSVVNQAPMNVPSQGIPTTGLIALT